MWRSGICSRRNKIPEILNSENETRKIPERPFIPFGSCGAVKNCLFYSPFKNAGNSGLLNAIAVGFALHFVEIQVDFAAKGRLNAVKTKMDGGVKKLVPSFFTPPLDFQKGHCRVSAWVRKYRRMA